MSPILRRTVVGLLLGFLVVPAASSAGEYHVYGCRLPDGAPAATDGWNITQDIKLPAGQETEPPTMGVGDPSWQGWVRGCAAGGGFGAVLNESTSPAAGGPRHAVLRFEPGSGVSISRGTFYRALSSYDSGRTELSYPRPAGDVGVLLNPTQQLDGTSGTASTGNTAVPLWPANRFDFPVSDGKGGAFPAGSIPWLDLIVSCEPAAPCSGAAAVLFRTDLVLSDPNGPVVDLVGGTMIEQAQVSPRVLRGNESITVAASDAGVGVERVRVEVDGQTVGEATLRGASGAACRWGSSASDDLPAAVLVRPCPASGSGTAVVDTTKLPDGAHELRVVVLDGSGSSTVAASGRVLVRNTDVVGPGSPDEFRGAANGGDGAQLAVGWSASAKAPSSRKTDQRRCEKREYREQHRVLCEGRVGKKNLTRPWSRTKSSQLGGRLLTSEGAPIRQANVDVFATTGDGARRPLGSVATDERGEFKSSVPLAPGSQEVAVQWRARVGDTVPSSVAQLALEVEAGSTFKASNVRAGARAKFSGRVVAGPLVASGASVRLQYRVGGRWTNFDSARANSEGRWSVRRSLNTPTTYSMRVAVDDSPLGLYEGATGAARSVRVR